MTLLLTLNVFHTFLSVSIVNFEHVIAGWARTTPLLPGRSFSTIPSFHKALFLLFLLMITTSPILTSCAFPLFFTCKPVR